MAHPLDLLRHHVTGAIERGEKEAVVAVHPAVTPADVLLMSPHERAYFTDEPVAHRVAQLDFERDLMIERRNASIARGISRNAVWAGRTR